MTIDSPVDAQIVAVEVDEPWPQTLVAWRSRRGILELDLILMAFVEDVYPSLQLQEQCMYQWLLLQKDTVLQQWLIYRKSPYHLTTAQQQCLDRVWAFMDGPMRQKAQ